MRSARRLGITAADGTEMLLGQGAAAFEQWFGMRPSLDLLVDIQQTGDIFFPKRWMDATLGGHRSAREREYLVAGAHQNENSTPSVGRTGSIDSPVRVGTSSETW